MDAATKALVRQRADERCEYCRIPQEIVPVSHHVEHIRARQHHGSDDPDNLALACDRCNAYKGPNLTTVSEVSQKIVELFHPREHDWDEHFKEEDGIIVGLTEIGQATVCLLKMNDSRRVELRRLAASG